MAVLKAGIPSIGEGITEFLPISSTGHTFTGYYRIALGLLVPAVLR